MSTLEEIRASLVAISRRHSRVTHEVEDLAHDVILSALRRGLALDGEVFRRSAHGAARRHAAFLARGAGRRRAREALCGAGHHTDADVGVASDIANDAGEGAPLSVLSPTLRTTLLLLLSGLDKAELRLALGVTDAALRKRFQALREHGPLSRPYISVPRRPPGLSQLRGAQAKLLPRLGDVLTADGRAPRVLATADPDGHGLIFVEALTPDRRTATPHASPTNHRTPAKGNRC